MALITGQPFSFPTNAAYIASVDEIYSAFPPRSEVVFLGDSRVQGAPWADIFPNVSVSNRGISGDTLSGLASRAPDLSASSPHVVIIQIGVNDILRGITVDDAAKAAESILVRNKSATGKVAITEIIDCQDGVCDRARLAALNGRLREIAAAQGAQFVEVNEVLAGKDGLLAEYTKDGIHLLGAGYKAFAGILCKNIDELKCD